MTQRLIVQLVSALLCAAALPVLRFGGMRQSFPAMAAGMAMLCAAVVPEIVAALHKK